LVERLRDLTRIEVFGDGVDELSDAVCMGCFGEYPVAFDGGRCPNDDRPGAGFDLLVYDGAKAVVAEEVGVSPHSVPRRFEVVGERLGEDALGLVVTDENVGHAVSLGYGTIGARRRRLICS